MTSPHWPGRLVDCAREGTLSGMLEHFVSVVGGMTLPFLLLAAVTVVLTPPVVSGWPRASRARMAAAGAGLAAATVFALLRAAAVLQSRTAVNLPTASLLVVADLALLVVLVVLTARTTWGYEGRFSVAASTVACAALALSFFRAAQEVILRLTAFIEPGEAVLSTETLLRVLGFLGGWVAVALLAFVNARALRRVPRRAAHLTVLAFGAAVALVSTVDLLRLLHATHRIVLHGSGFRALTWATNNAQGAVLIVAAALLLVPMVALFASTLRSLPELPNPARVRAERSGRRRSRRWVMASALGFSALALTRTVAVARVNEVPTLSEPEQYTLDEAAGLVRLPTSALADGHLHRYAYTTGTTEVRFIAILKNGGAYGVGLDACENCGPSGYYEADGKVICLRCDVAINPATIGFQGGCNPIPLDFAVDGGDLTIATSVLEDNAEVFA
ncbi:DUF2318 domain-containing protein [Actinomyces wuliandei]|uniref:DUF2318 domain-containing protein n=1 Tax=Actinomyces wuliandei TaxID=2057743 RepID=UPI001FAB106A|nr:DUF2318 domain-containing protein [Actinomyces wuliandei]